MLNVGVRAACFTVFVAVSVACSSFGVETSPLSPDGSSSPHDAAAAGDASTTADAAAGCTEFSSDFENGDLAANGFVEATGDIKVAPGSVGRVLLASVSTAGAAETGSYASHEVDIADPADKLDYVEVEFDLSVVGFPKEGTLTFGCMLYARASRLSSGDHNQLSLRYDDRVFASLDRRHDDEPQDEAPSKDIADAMPSSVAIKVRLKLAVTEGSVVGSVHVGEKVVETTKVPLARSDPRFVTVKCGIPYAQTGTGEIDMGASIDNLSGRVCTKR